MNEPYPGFKLTATVMRVTPSTVAANVGKLRDHATQAALSWTKLTPEERMYYASLVKHSLFHLLQNDSWIPGSAVLNEAVGLGARLDVHLVIELDPDAPAATSARTQMELAEAVQESFESIRKLLENAEDI